MTKTIRKTTPVLTMWFTFEPKETEKDSLLLPHASEGKKADIDYVKVLQQECFKLQEAGAPLFLTYTGRNLTEAQKQAMKDLASKPGLENLMVIDYDGLEKRMGDIEADCAVENFETRRMEKGRIKISKEELIAGINRIFDQELNATRKTRLIYLIDAPRLVMLYNSGLMRQLAKEQYAHDEKRLALLETCSPGMIYRDFDVNLLDDMVDIDTRSGFISSIGFDEIRKNIMDVIDDKTINFTDEERKAHREFFERELADPWQVKKNFLLACRHMVGDDDKLDKREMAKKLINSIHSPNSQQRDAFTENDIDYILELDRKHDILRPLNEEELAAVKKNDDQLNEILSRQDPLFYPRRVSFSEMLLKDSKIENSLLGVYCDEEEHIASAVCQTFQEREIGRENFIFQTEPYASVMIHFSESETVRFRSTNSANRSFIGDKIAAIMMNDIFYIGHDFTWQNGPGNQQSATSGNIAKVGETGISSLQASSIEGNIHG